MNKKRINRNWRADAMKSFLPATVVAVFTAVFASSVAAAPPYQIEVVGSLGQAKAKTAAGEKRDSDTLDVSIKYYLQIVDTPTGPLMERAFLDKSAFVGGSFEQRKPDVGEDTDTIELAGRFVTDTDIILEFTYDKEDDGSPKDDTTTTIGIGKYLDGQTTAIVSYEQAKSTSDTNTITGEYRKLIQNESVGTAIATDFEIGYIDGESNNGYSASAAGTYYLSDIMSVGALLKYTKIKSFNDKTLGLVGSYFFAENMFVAGTFATSDRSDDIDLSIFGISVGARF